MDLLKVIFVFTALMILVVAIRRLDDKFTVWHSKRKWRKDEDGR